MNTKEKAQELYFEMLNNGKGLISDFLAKRNAVTCAQNCLEIAQWYKDKFPILKEHSEKRISYWQDVIKNLKKLI